MKQAVTHIHVCIVVFNRYDLLKRLMTSIRNSNVTPHAVYVIDRGRNPEQLALALGPLHRDVYESQIKGVARYRLGQLRTEDEAELHLPKLSGNSLPEAWNWFLRNVPEERILASDDIEFFPETLETFVKTPGDFVGLHDEERSSHFACFLLRDSCIEKVGYFDPDISPDYMYFEDCDYAYRMKLLGIPEKGISCMHHGLAQSWEKKTLEQQNEHHTKFLKAQANYVRKWGGLPRQERFLTPYNQAVEEVR